MEPQDVKDAMAEFYSEQERSPLYIPLKDHYDDHEFVGDLRSGVGIARKASIGSIVLAVLSFLYYAIKLAWKHIIV